MREGSGYKPTDLIKLHHCTCLLLKALGGDIRCSDSPFRISFIKFSFLFVFFLGRGGECEGVHTFEIFFGVGLVAFGGAGIDRSLSDAGLGHGHGRCVVVHFSLLLFCFLHCLRNKSEPSSESWRNPHIQTHTHTHTRRHSQHVPLFEYVPQPPDWRPLAQ